uniref:Thioredoxin domain-containing protein n=1 Tax=Astyanax mexicanus TaxID=7994 RepID=A0A8B9HJA5_ASTMX
MPGLLLGDVVPNFEAETTIGTISLHEFLGDSWGILFSHPRDYTPVCTTELGRAAKLCPEFTKRNVKMIALSIDTVEDHHGWSKDILAYNNDETVTEFPFPIIADYKRELAVELGMLDPVEKDQTGMPLTARCVSTATAGDQRGKSEGSAEFEKLLICRGIQDTDAVWGGLLLKCVKMTHFSANAAHQTHMWLIDTLLWSSSKETLCIPVIFA